MRGRHEAADEHQGWQGRERGVQGEHPPALPTRCRHARARSRQQNAPHRTHGCALCSQTFGCGSAIASSSYATEWLKGKTLDEAATIKNSDIASHLKLPPVKLHCSMLAEDAIKAAITDYKTKQEASAARVEQADQEMEREAAAGGR